MIDQTAGYYHRHENVGLLKVTDETVYLTHPIRRTRKGPGSPGNGTSPSADGQWTGGACSATCRIRIRCWPGWAWGWRSIAICYPTRMSGAATTAASPARCPGEWEIRAGGDTQADKKALAIAEEGLARLTSTRIILEMLDAPFFGLSPVEITWEHQKKPMAAGQGGRQAPRVVRVRR